MGAPAPDSYIEILENPAIRRGFFYTGKKGVAPQKLIYKPSNWAGVCPRGGRFGYALDWKYFNESGKVQVSTDIGALYPKFGGLVRDALGYTKDLQTSKLLNVTAFPSTIDTKRAEVMNISGAFINRAIIGTADLEGDWTAMLAELDKAGYSNVKAVMKETAVELGIIDG